MNRTWLSSSLIALLTATLCPSGVVAQQARGDLLVSVSWLAERLNDADLVLLHMGPQEDYDREHIPGARYISRLDFAVRRTADDLTLEVPPADEVEATMERLGISDDSRIVLYWSDGWVTPTTRILFTLDWAGFGDRTVLLDGGLDAWKAAGHQVTDAVPSVRRGSVSVRPKSELVVDAAWVQAHAARPGYALLDGRSAAYYDGVEGDDGKAGHIPGAGSVPWTELIDESLLLRTPAELRRIFESAGVEPGDTVVAYCHIGQYATMVMFAARTLGFEVKLYDGAFQDWARRNLPVEAGNR